MYAYIYGQIVEKEPENLIVEANQIGYNIHIAPGMVSRFPEVGQMAKIYTYTSVREDAFWLYGFTSIDELNLFKLLITVSGIGPKGAMGVLSVMDVDTLRLAILSQDVKMIAKAPGVGAKSASRIVLELKDKLTGEIPEANTGSAAVIPASAGNKASEASAALASLGYSQSEIGKALKGIDIDNLSLEEIVRMALRAMVMQ